jgi:flagellar basal-body rod modification protein FlgD
MAIDAIGSVLNSNSTNSLNNSTINQEDFIKLFLSELNYQDPLEPVDNKEFLAQMAQFANIEQTRQTSENIQNLVLLNSTEQSVGLLGRNVQAATESGVYAGKVMAVNFQSDGALLTIKTSDGSVLTGIRMSQISLVQP